MLESPQPRRNRVVHTLVGCAHTVGCWRHEHTYMLTNLTYAQSRVLKQKQESETRAAVLERCALTAELYSRCEAYTELLAPILPEYRRKTTIISISIIFKVYVKL